MAWLPVLSDSTTVTYTITLTYAYTDANVGDWHWQRGQAAAIACTGMLATHCALAQQWGRELAHPLGRFV